MTCIFCKEKINDKNYRVSKDGKTYTHNNCFGVALGFMMTEATQKMIISFQKMNSNDEKMRKQIDVFNCPAEKNIEKIYV